MNPTEYVEFNDLSAEADTKWFKLWANALKPTFQQLQEQFWDAGQDKPCEQLVRLYAESVDVS